MKNSQQDQTNKFTVYTERQTNCVLQKQNIQLPLNIDISL